MLPALVLASGAAAVALEVLWIRDFALWFGSTAGASAAVLAVYFAGLALGARVGGRLRRRPPLATYARVEAGVALVVGLYVLARPWMPAVVARADGTTPAALLPLAHVLLAAVVLLVPTTLLGATLPVAAAAAPDRAGAARLYAWNTLGGATGALAVAFVLLPALGARATFLLLVGVDLAVAAVAASLSSPPAIAASPALRGKPPHIGSVVAAIAGCAALAAEVLWMRGLSGVLSASVYSVALVLAATLIGIVAGTAVAVRVVARVERPTRALAIAGGVATIALVLSTVALHALPGLSLALAHATPDPGLRLAGEAVLALLVVLVPSAAIGAVLPLTLAFGDRQDPAEALAAPLAANTAGGIAGALAGAFVLLPLLGLGGGLLAIAATLGILTAALATSPAARIAAGSMAVALALSAVCGPALPFPWRAAPGEHVLLERDGPTATVLVTSDAQGNRRLRVNGQYALGGDDGLFIERREGVLPVLLHPAPRRLLHLGVGTGDTLGASMTSPGIVADGVELVDDAFAVAAVFADQNDDVTHDPRVRLVADDARSVLLASGARWDVIDTDLVLPWTSGAGALFSREFYELGLAHLAAGGLFCQWLPLHQLAVGDLEAIVATFTDVFPRAQMWVAYHRALEPIVALVGSVGPVVVDPPALRRRLEDPRFRTMAGSVGLDDPDDLGLLYVTDGVHLRAAVRDVEPITDDRPRIEFSAPRAYYAQEGLGRAGLAWVAARLDPAPAPVAGPQSATFELRATLLRAELALLDGDRPLELRAYLDALGRAPTSPTVLAALGAIAAERRRAGDVGTADAIARAVSATHAGS